MIEQLQTGYRNDQEWKKVGRIDEQSDLGVDNRGIYASLAKDWDSMNEVASWSKLRTTAIGTIGQ